MPRFINCLILNTEIWAINLRLKYEYQFYDKFIITESRQTFSGEAKPLYFEKYRSGIADPLNKIIYVVLDTLPYEPETQYTTHKGEVITGNRWPCEHAMRNACKPALAALDLTRDDFIVVQDVDEITNLDAIRSRSTEMLDNQVHKFGFLDFRDSVAPNHCKEKIWEGSYMVRGNLAQDDLHDLRRLHVQNGTLQHWHIQSPMFVSKLDGTPMYDLIERPDLLYTRGAQMDEPLGWHLSGMSGGFTKLRHYKTRSFAHAEVDFTSAIESDDLWEETRAFMAGQVQAGKYNFTRIDGRLPRFVKDNIRDYPVLLRPQA